MRYLKFQFFLGINYISVFLLFLIPDILLKSLFMLLFVNTKFVNIKFYKRASHRKYGMPVHKHFFFNGFCVIYYPSSLVGQKIDVT